MKRALDIGTNIAIGVVLGLLVLVAAWFAVEAGRILAGVG